MPLSPLADAVSWHVACSMSRSENVMGLKLFPLALVLGATVLLATPSAQTSGEPERYSASAINTNNGTVNNVDITVNRWSTDRERDALIAGVRFGDRLRSSRRRR